MESPSPNSGITPRVGNATVANEVNSGLPLKGADLERMAKRRYQAPKPVRRGVWWTMLVWQDDFREGVLNRKRKRVKLAPATMPEREVLKVAAEYLRPLNQGLESIGSATNFAFYVNNTYNIDHLPLMAKSTQDRYGGVIRNYLLPAFGEKCLRDLTPKALQHYFTGFVSSPLSHESRDKIRDVLSSILQTAIPDLLARNPMENVKMPPEKRGKRRNKPYLTPAQFLLLLALIPEPYATMIFVAIPTRAAGQRTDRVAL